MKRILSLLLCLVLLGSCAFGVLADTTDPIYDPTENNTGSTYGRNFFIFVLVLGALGCVYLFFKFRK